MVRNTLLPFGFYLFYGVVEEEIDEDGIDL